MPAQFQRVLALSGLLLIAPLLAGFALAIKVETPGPVLYRARRVGRGGSTFSCFKLRTMTVTTDGPAITTRTDARVTRTGAFLRRFRLDELPQLWNVVRGEMLLVGPRPEDPRFVVPSDDLHRRVFTAMPGITGVAQLVFSDEATLLDPTDPEGSYRERVLPDKVALDARYLAHRSLRLDLWILVATLQTVAGHKPGRAAVEARL